MSPMLAATETNRIAGEARSGETYSECVGNASCAWKLREPPLRRCRCAPQLYCSLYRRRYARRDIGDALTRYRYIQYPSHAIARHVITRRIHHKYTRHTRAQAHRPPYCVQYRTDYCIFTTVTSIHTHPVMIVPSVWFAHPAVTRETVDRLACYGRGA